MQLPVPHENIERQVVAGLAQCDILSIIEEIMSYYFFAWSPEIEEHLAEHDVSPEEFEEVVSDPDTEDISRSTGNPIAFGWTSEGRYLCCVFKRSGDDIIEPVTAYEVEE